MGLRRLLLAAALGCWAGDRGTGAPSVLSRRREWLAAAPWGLQVSDHGALAITVGGARFEVTSQFSEPGPVWNSLSEAQTDEPRAWQVAVDRSGAAGGTWVVHASAQTFTLRRKLQLVPPPPQLPHKLLVNDTITSTAPTVIGMHVRHYAALTSGDVASAAVPGRINAGTCGNP